MSFVTCAIPHCVTQHKTPCPWEFTNSRLVQGVSLQPPLLPFPSWRCRTPEASPQVYREALLSLLGCFWHTVFDCSPSWRSDHGLKALSPDTPHFQRVTTCPLPSETNHRCVLYVAFSGHMLHTTQRISLCIVWRDCRTALNEGKASRRVSERSEKPKWRRQWTKWSPRKATAAVSHTPQEATGMKAKLRVQLQRLKSRSRSRWRNGPTDGQQVHISNEVGCFHSREAEASRTDSSLSSFAKHGMDRGQASDSHHRCRATGVHLFVWFRRGLLHFLGLLGHGFPETVLILPCASTASIHPYKWLVPFPLPGMSFISLLCTQFWMDGATHVSTQLQSYPASSKWCQKHLEMESARAMPSLENHHSK